MPENFRTEEFKVEGEKLLARIKELIHEGNIRRVIIKDKDGKVMIEFPMTFGVAGVLIAPQLAAIGAIAALLTEATIVVERRNKHVHFQTDLLACDHCSNRHSHAVRKTEEERIESRE